MVDEIILYYDARSKKHQTMNMVRQLISEEDTFLWLAKGDLKAETESEIVAAQDQALNTKYYATNADIANNLMKQ